MRTLLALVAVGFLNDVTGGNLLGWKVVVATAVFAMAGFQVALAARFWGVGGLAIKPEVAVKMHRWNGRILLFGAVVVALACLVGPAGSTSPTRAVLHSIFGTVLFLALIAKLTLLKLTKKYQGLIPMAGILLFVSFLAVWATSVADYVAAR